MNFEDHFLAGVLEVVQKDILSVFQGLMSFVVED
jgi:hypothetical protein